MHSRCSTGAVSSVRAYSLAIIVQSNTALCATSTRPASRSANSPAISENSGASASTSAVSPCSQLGPGSRCGLTSVYQWSSTSPLAVSRYTAADTIRSLRRSPVVSTSTTAYPPGYPAGHGSSADCWRGMGAVAAWWSSSMVTEDTARHRQWPHRRRELRPRRDVSAAAGHVCPRSDVRCETCCSTPMGGLPRTCGSR